jgi:hypothetical protein
MPFTAWEIGLKIGATSNASRMFNAMAVAAERANKAVFGLNTSMRASSRAMRSAALRAETLGAGLGAAAAGANTLTAATDRVAVSAAVATRRFNVLGEAARKAFIGVGVGAGIFAYEGIKGAADLQKSMTNLSITTGTYGPGAKNAATRAAMRSMVLDVSSYTAQDTNTIAQEMLVASQGINNPKRLMAAFPAIAKFADVLQQVKGQDPTEAVRVATSLSHLWGIYSGKPLQGMLDNIFKIAMTQPEGLSNVLTQARYFSSAVQLGVPMNDIFSTIALMGQTGYLRGKGGTGLNSLLMGSIQAAAVGGHLSKRQAAARRELQLESRQFDFYDKNRNFRFQPLLDHLAAMRALLGKRTGNPAEFVKDVTDLFGKSAAPFVTAITSPTARAQQRNIQAAMVATPGVQAAWAIISKNFAFQWQTLATNVSNLTKNIWKPMTETLTPAVAAFASQLGRLSNWFDRNPRVGMDVAIAAFELVGGAAVLAARKLWALDAAITALGKGGWVAAAGVGATAAETAAVGSAITRTGLIGGLAAASRGLWALAGPIGWYVAILQGVSWLHDLASAQWPGIDKPFPGSGSGGFDRNGNSRSSQNAWRNFGDYPLQTPNGLGNSPPAGIFGKGKGTFGVPLVDGSGRRSFGVVVPIDQVMSDLRGPGTSSGEKSLYQTIAALARKMSASQVTVHIDKPTFVLPKGTTREMALAFLKEISKNARTAMRTGGDNGHSMPNFSRTEAGPWALSQ